MAKHLIKNWKGSRASYNLLKANNLIDAWTKYYVIDTVDSATTVTEYFGLNPVSDKCGDFTAVNDIVQEPPLNLNPYDRFLVGTDATGYKIYEYTPIKNSNLLSLEIRDFDWKHGVRVFSRGLKCFVYYNGHLVTYDDVDCGEF
jgi:hypothetical protein